MPEYWYNESKIKINGEDNEQERKEKEFNKSIAATNKPYFMIYVYPQLKRRLQTYIKDNVNDMQTAFCEYNFKDIEDLKNHKRKTKRMKEFIDFYDKGICVGKNPCVINKICWMFEKEFPNYSSILPKENKFDYTILKSDSAYSQNDYDEIKKLYENYKYEFDSYRQKVNTYGFTDELEESTHDDFVKRFKTKAQKICSNEQELCNIVLDICYQKEASKQFAWDVSGNVIIKNLLENNDYIVNYPSHSGSEFEYCGELFEMKSISVKEDSDNDNFE